jgi:hypothetical protein
MSFKERVPVYATLSVTLSSAPRLQDIFCLTAEALAILPLTPRSLMIRAHLTRVYVYEPPVARSPLVPGLCLGSFGGLRNANPEGGKRYYFL